MYGPCKYLLRKAMVLCNERLQLLKIKVRFWIGRSRAKRPVWYIKNAGGFHRQQAGHTRNKDGRKRQGVVAPWGHSDAKAWST